METNELYPVFLKVNVLNILIVGGGNVAEEKLHFLLKSSPGANVTVVAPEIKQELLALEGTVSIKFIKDVYDPKYLEGKHIAIATTDNVDVNIQVYQDCRDRNVLVNVADNPPYCDFYMGGIVTKGNVKIAISTNGKSPTVAKRLRQFFEEVIPENIDDFVQNLNSYRNTIKGDFEEKVEKLNEFTKSLISKS
ncbi:precorrin-2 dehydrogenase/sirohydrochlorin ferrochelatase family protein [Robertkochia solimangrovi]|uniref:precorrin-2 dehydrogenase/sirohydrochlorin ferrochelatase family protein n=1 Tax=Robertkochia solimangrovi TaxID=2213046 RepID=UPI00117F509A|nr:bifunctional precorrin-2 dehydrogenase/sirohydrochlorin ferrochelatase [Robertkochia solimangrovi]TRZ44394.1 bifunctional precorrin-2 dehydrogenase/sirohydrochlorin ferrochelatase [Robertkochia solimangrovi]